MKKVILYLIVLLFIYSVSASHEVTTSDGGDSYSINESVSFLYNITVNNTDPGQTANITQIDITLHSTIKFIEGTEGSDSDYESFLNTSITLSWSNLTGYIINGGDSKSFWFNANATTSGNYTLIIETFNSTGEQSSGISVEVLPISQETNCTSNWTCTSWSNCVNWTQTRICTDKNSCGTNEGKPGENKNCTMGSCVPNWNCTEWSGCVGGTQMRSCVDTNTCGDNSEKPDEEKSCVSACTPIWDCTDWQPEECTIEEKEQTRTCTDENSCGTNKGKPDEKRDCVPNTNPYLLYLILMVIIITLIVIVGIISYKVWKKNKFEEEVVEESPYSIVL